MAYALVPLAFLVSAVDLVLRVPGGAEPNPGNSLATAPLAFVDLDDWRGGGACRVALVADGIVLDAYGLVRRKIPFESGTVSTGAWNDSGEWNILILALKRRLTVRTSPLFSTKVVETFSRWERARLLARAPGGEMGGAR